MISCYAAFFMDKKYKKTAATCYAQERRSFREMCLKFWGCIDLEYIHTCTHTHKKNIRTHAHTHTHSNTENKRQTDRAERKKERGSLRERRCLKVKDRAVVCGEAV